MLGRTYIICISLKYYCQYFLSRLTHTVRFTFLIVTLKDT